MLQSECMRKCSAKLWLGLNLWTKWWTSFLSHVLYSTITWFESKKMKAGRSQLKPVLLFVIFNLCFYASYQLTDLKVRLRFGNVIAGVFTRISKWQHIGIVLRNKVCIVAVLLFITFSLPSHWFVLTGMWALQRYNPKWHHSGPVLLLISWSDRRALLLEE